MTPVVLILCYHCRTNQQPTWWTEEYELISSEHKAPGGFGLCENLCGRAATYQDTYVVRRWDPDETFDFLGWDYPGGIGFGLSRVRFRDPDQDPKMVPR